MEKAELIFIPSLGVGHLTPTTELAKLMTNRDERLSATILVMKPPYDSKISNQLKSLSTPPSITLIQLPSDEQPPPPPVTGSFLSSFIETQKPHVRNVVSKLIEGPPRRKVAGFVIGMFCTAMIDVANQFGVASYVFFASSAGSLRVMLHMQGLNDEHSVDTTEFKDSDAQLTVPGFSNLVPARVLPSVVFKKEWHPVYYGNARRYREAKGIVFNSFVELESYAIRSFSSDREFNVPPVYPVGPIVNCEGMENDEGSSKMKAEIIEWLDGQPPLSVVFLCFGSMGSFDEAQVKEIAVAVEQSGFKFLWSLRQPPPKGKMGLPTDYINVEHVLPEGFLDRTATIGRVIGWAPQVAILAHRAIGGFVSHCGWNSILESLWFGVPIAAWPLYAEQQLNAFELIIELGLAAEIKMDYRRELAELLSAEDIERGIRHVMEQENDVRNRVKDMSAKCKEALCNGGSSISTVDHFIRDVMDNIK